MPIHFPIGLHVRSSQMHARTNYNHAIYAVANNSLGCTRQRSSAQDLFSASDNKENCLLMR